MAWTRPVVQPHMQVPGSACEQGLMAVRNGQQKRSAFRMTAGYYSYCLVLPSISVHRKVTVPIG